MSSYWQAVSPVPKLLVRVSQSVVCQSSIIIIPRKLVKNSNSGSYLRTIELETQVEGEGWGAAMCFNDPSRWFWRMLKFENNCSRGTWCSVWGLWVWVFRWTYNSVFSGGHCALTRCESVSGDCACLPSGLEVVLAFTEDVLWPVCYGS